MTPLWHRWWETHRVKLAGHRVCGHELTTLATMVGELRTAAVPALGLSVVAQSGEYIALVQGEDRHEDNRRQDSRHMCCGIGSLAKAVVDEHLAVDVDTCERRFWLDCADVLHGSRPRSITLAVRHTDHMLARHPGCRVASVPLKGGGCLAAERTGAHIVVASDSPVTMSVAEQALFSSFVHAWLSAGHGLGELVSVLLLPGPATALPVHCG